MHASVTKKNQSCTYLVYCVLSFHHVRLHCWAAKPIPLVEALAYCPATPRERHIKYIMPLCWAILDSYPAEGVQTHVQ